MGMRSASGDPPWSEPDGGAAAAASSDPPGDSAGGMNSIGEAEYIPVPGRSPLPPRRIQRRRRRGRGRPGELRKPPLSVELILEWADKHHQRTGAWPNSNSGPVAEAPRENWGAIDSALAAGTRGLPGRHSIARLLAHHRGARNRSNLPRLTEEKILQWADLHRERTGEWPTGALGPIPDAPEECWSAVRKALSRGCRGLPGGQSLLGLLVRERGVRDPQHLPPVSDVEILAWADAHHARTGDWPRRSSGPIPEAPGETWSQICSALKTGARGAAGGRSLARLLLQARGVVHHLAKPPLTERRILEWADAYHARWGRWPTVGSGPVEPAPQEDWRRIDQALRMGQRGLSGGASLARLLAEKRSARTSIGIPRLTEEIILEWADAHFERTGKWPSQYSGVVYDAPGEIWSRINTALLSGQRGLPGGSSLPKLLRRERGRRHLRMLSPFTEEQILEWADAYHAACGAWPRIDSGLISGADAYSWHSLDAALRQGARGLPGGSSLAQLLQEKRGVRNRKRLPHLTEDQIAAWAAAHHARTGKWPTAKSGEIADAPGETWCAAAVALSNGIRGLDGGTSLAKLLQDRHGVRIRNRPPDLTLPQILEWANRHRSRTGAWPSENSGEIVDAPGETWLAVHQALRQGKRGIVEKTTLARLLRENTPPEPPES